VQPGPFGHGPCLVRRSTDPAGVLCVTVLAPPGVPIDPPELADRLLRWRVARWEDGAAAGGAKVLSLDDALAVAPSAREWITEQLRERHRRAVASEHVQIVSASPPSGRTTADVSPTAAGTGWPRPPVELTRSASTFAYWVGSQSSGDCVKQIAQAVNQTRSLEALRAELAVIESHFPSSLVADGVTAVLHARARSHSWRYTAWIPSASPLSPLARRVATEVDDARDARDLQQRLEKLRSDGAEVDVLLVELLHRRARSMRWCLTHRARLLLASHRLRGLRRVLREHVQPLRHVSISMRNPLHFHLNRR
jgi:hypothetical protein